MKEENKILQKNIFIATVLFLAFVFSGAMIWWVFNDIEIFQAISPVYITLIITTGFSFYVYFDQKKENRKKEQERQMFETAVNSHFSKFIIEKRIEFYEKITKIKFREVILSAISYNKEDMGMLRESISKTLDLYYEYKVWLSEGQEHELQSLIMTFFNCEDTLDNIWLIKNDKKREKEIDKYMDQIISIQRKSKDQLPDMENELRRVLGIDEITKLHQHMFNLANNYIKK